jgi:hypothetical protein
LLGSKLNAKCRSESSGPLELFGRHSILPP